MFGKRLRELRKKKGWTQEQLGKKVNKSKNNISQYETGKREPDLDILNKFAELFDVTVDYLLGRTDDPDIKILEGDSIPEELKEIGVEYMSVAKYAQLKKVDVERLKKLIDALSDD